MKVYEMVLDEWCENSRFKAASVKAWHEYCEVKLLLDCSSSEKGGEGESSSR